MREPPAPDEPAAGPALDALWGRVLSAWDDDRAHDAVRQYGLRTHSLAELAGRYRELLDDPGKAQRAKAQIDAIVAAVTAELAATKTPKPARVPVAIVLSAFGACTLLLGWLGWVLWGPK
ncbi:MAG: hypothetical protein ABTD50_19700 [Polyangiaceae bacterium]